MVRGTRGQNTVGQRQRDRRELGPTQTAGKVLLLHVHIPTETARGHEAVERTQHHTGQRGAAQARLENIGAGFQRHQETRLVPRGHGQLSETVGSQHAHGYVKELPLSGHVRWRYRVPIYFA